MPVRHTHNKQKIIAIVGPTASGKSSFALTLAKKFRGEIISADSRQIYRGMDSIAGISSKKETAGIPHHLLRIADPKRQFSAGEFEKKAIRLAQQIDNRGNIPIIVGGTGFYIDALLSDVVLPKVGPNKRLRAKLEKKTTPKLYFQLQQLDPHRAKTIDQHNKVRLIRAIEIVKALGSVPSLQRQMKYNVLWLGLRVPKNYERKIRARIRARMAHGMLREARTLSKKLSKKRLHELGMEFELATDCAEKKISHSEFKEKLLQWELQYAKRQMRWLLRNQKIVWVKNKQEILHLAKKFLSS